VSLRRKLFSYLLFIHVSFAVVVTYLLWDHRIWLLAVEAFSILSFLIGLRIFRELFQPLELVTSGVEFMKEGDFTTRLRKLGPPEMDALVSVYNQMVDHLRAERVRIQEQHYFLERILSVSPAAIITLDYDERISFVNRAGESLLQLSFTELKGKRVKDLDTPFASAMSEVTMGDAAIILLRGVRKVKCYKSHFIDQGHRRTFYMVEELTDELRRTEKAAYEKLIRMLSHEVNNSLGAANSLLHSCLHYKDQLRGEDRDDFESALTVAIARAEHLNSFMKSFADIVKLPLPRRQAADIRAILQDLVSLLDADLTKRRITIVWDVQGAVDAVLVDRHQMEQVLLNVLKNAMEAIGAGGVITIRLGKAGRNSFVTIEDTGCGMTDETRRHLFTPFFSTKENGRGVGLTLVQEILVQHKFEFSLDSIPGQPTRFTILFTRS